MNAGGQTIRGRILGVIEAATRPLTGHEIAQAVAVPYKPVIDALNALLNQGRIHRLGRTFKARWVARPEPTTAAALAELEGVFLRRPATGGETCDQDWQSISG